MPQIPLAQRERILPGGSELPGPSFERVQIAGTAGRGIAGIGSALADIGLKAQNANDNAELQLASVNIEGQWQKAKERLSNITDPTDFQNAANKELATIAKNAEKTLNFRNKKRFKPVVASLTVNAEKDIFREFTAKTVDNSKAALVTTQTTLINDVVSGKKNLNTGRQINSIIVNDMVKNGILSKEDAAKKIESFDFDISNQLFLKELEGDPKGINSLSRDKIRDKYNMTEEQATKAKFTAESLDKKENIKIRDNIGNHLNSLQNTGIGDPDTVKLAESNLDKDELAKFKQAETNAIQIHTDSVDIKGMTVGEINNKLTTLIPKGGKDFEQENKRFEAFIINGKIELDLIKKDPYGSVIKKDEQKFKTKVDEISEMVSRQKARGIQFTAVSAKSERDNIIAQYTKSDATGKRGLITSLTGQYGRYAENLMFELSEDGLPVEANLMVILSERSPSEPPAFVQSNLASISGVSISKLKEAIADEGLQKTVLEKTFNQMKDFTNTMPPGDVEQKLVYQDLAARYGLFMLADGQASSWEEVSIGISKLFDDRYYYSGTLAIPKGKGYDKDKIEGFLSRRLRGKLLKENDVKFDEDFTENTKQPFLNATGEWYTNEDESGAKLYINGLEARKIVAGKDESVEFFFDDIMKIEIRRVPAGTGLSRRQITRIEEVE